MPAEYYRDCLKTQFSIDSHRQADASLSSCMAITNAACSRYLHWRDISFAYLLTACCNIYNRKCSLGMVHAACLATPCGCHHPILCFCVRTMHGENDHPLSDSFHQSPICMQLGVSMCLQLRVPMRTQLGVSMHMLLTQLRATGIAARIFTLEYPLRCVHTGT